MDDSNTQILCGSMVFCVKGGRLLKGKIFSIGTKDKCEQVLSFYTNESKKSKHSDPDVKCNNCAILEKEISALKSKK